MKKDSNKTRLGMVAQAFNTSGGRQITERAARAV